MATNNTDVDQQTSVIASIGTEAEHVLARLAPCYTPMVEALRDALPEVRRQTEVHAKGKTQFANAALDNTHLTPTRCLRQVCVDLEQTRAAIKYRAFEIAKNEARARMKDEAAEEAKGAECDLLTIEAAELRSNIQDAEIFIGGAVRRGTSLLAQFKSLKQAIGKEYVSEADVEEDSPREHIMKAFQQALCAAYARGGTIDEGNHIYFCNLGISGTNAQAEITARINGEKQVGGIHSPEAHHQWLTALADKYEGLAQRSMGQRGLLSETVAAALLTEGGGDE